MLTWEQFQESKNEKSDTSKLHAVVDIAAALQKVFKDYTLETRKNAWKRITSKDGLEEVQKLLKTPSRSLSPFRTLT